MRTDVAQPVCTQCGRAFHVEVAQDAFEDLERCHAFEPLRPPRQFHTEYFMVMLRSALSPDGRACFWGAFARSPYRRKYPCMYTGPRDTLTRAHEQELRSALGPGLNCLTHNRDVISAAATTLTVLSRAPQERELAGVQRRPWMMALFYPACMRTEIERWLVDRFPAPHTTGVHAEVDEVAMARQLGGLIRGKRARDPRDQDDARSDTTTEPGGVAGKHDLSRATTTTAAYSRLLRPRRRDEDGK